jgi:hypothetical protein
MVTRHRTIHEKTNSIGSPDGFFAIDSRMMGANEEKEYYEQGRSLTCQTSVLTAAPTRATARRSAHRRGQDYAAPWPISHGYWGEVTHHSRRSNWSAIDGH